MKARILLAHMVVGLALLAPLGAAAQPDAPPWKFSLMPYLWVPSVDGKLNFGPPPPGGGSANIKIDTNSVLDNLDFAFMINGEARKGRWLVATDVIYLDFGHVDSSAQSVTFDLGPRGRIDVGAGENSGTQSKLKGWLWTAVGGYAAIQDPRANLDVIGGFRYLGLDATTNWQLSGNVTVTDPVTGATIASFQRQGSASKSDNLWAGIVGAKGRAKLGASDWFVNYYADVGGWSNLFTWQGAAGIGYAFRWGDVLLDYRYLYYSDSGQDKLIDHVSFGGFALGVNFRF
jgi:opacity protein-like surface antigen